MTITRCNCCGRELFEGALKYIVEIRSFADYDGSLEDYEGDLEEGINELLDAVEGMDADELEEDVYKVQVYILCRNCRDKFGADPFQTGASAFEYEETKGTIH